MLDTATTINKTIKTNEDRAAVVFKCLNVLTLANDTVLLPNNTINLDLVDTFVAKALITIINKTLFLRVALVNNFKFKRV